MVLKIFLLVNTIPFNLAAVETVVDEGVATIALTTPIITPVVEANSTKIPSTISFVINHAKLPKLATLGLVYISYNNQSSNNNIQAITATRNSLADTVWYPDTGATHLLTSDLTNLNLRHGWTKNLRSTWSSYLVGSGRVKKLGQRV